MRLLSTKTDNRRLANWGWCLFDFANSVAAVIGGVYFTKWYVSDLASGNLSLNMIFLVSAFIILLAGAWIGKRIDIDGYRFWMYASVTMSFLSVLAIFVLSQLEKDTFTIPCVFFSFVLFLFGYQVSRIGHNTYLRRAIPIELQERMSGYGAASNWLGSIVGIALTIPIVTAYPGELGREFTFLLAAAVYGILSFVSMFMMFKFHTDSPPSPDDITLKKYSIVKILLMLGWAPVVYFLLFDTMTMVQRNLPPYLTEIIFMPDDMQAFGFLFILVSAALGGIFAARCVNFKNCTRFISFFAAMLAVAIILVTVGRGAALWLSFPLAGVSYGVLESSIRLSYMKNFGRAEAGRYFGLYAVIERSSGVFGPAVWIVPFLIFADQALNYILALSTMAAFAIVASFISVRFLGREEPNFIR